MEIAYYAPRNGNKTAETQFHSHTHQARNYTAIDGIMINTPCDDDTRIMLKAYRVFGWNVCNKYLLCITHPNWSELLTPRTVMRNSLTPAEANSCKCRMETSRRRLKRWMDDNANIGMHQHDDSDLIASAYNTHAQRSS